MLFLLLLLYRIALFVPYIVLTYVVVDITEHKLVPEHVVMTAQEVKELLLRYKLEKFQLPRIQVHDPVARWVGYGREGLDNLHVKIG